MSGDRFEIELRDLLRQEASTAPVVMTMPELRARAGRRSRWGGFGPFTLAGRATAAVATVAIVAVGFAVLQSSRHDPGIAASASPAVTSSPSSAASPNRASPSPVSSPAVAAFDLGSSGTVIVGRPRTPQDGLTIVAIDPTGTEAPLATVGAADLSGWSVSLDPRPPDGALSPTGRLAVIVQRGSLDQPEYATAVLDLTHPGSAPLILPDGVYAFEPDGTLVFETATDSALMGGEIDRYPPGASTPSSITDIATDLQPVTLGNRHLALAADGNGVIVSRDRSTALVALSPEYLVTRWDRSLQQGVPAILAQGDGNRPFGSAGQTAFRWSSDGPTGSQGGLAVEGPLTKRVETGDATARDFAWTPDGTHLMLLDGSVIRSFDGAHVSSVRSIDPALAAQRIAGVTAGALLLMDDAGLVTSVPLDRSGSSALRGVLLAVVP